MFFFLSKTLNYLTMPLTIVFVCMVTGIFLKNAKWKRRSLLSGVILLFVFTNDFISNELMHAWEIETKPFHTMHRYKVGIVLTGATIPFLVPNDRVYFYRGAGRVIHTVQLYKLGLIEKILISGGSGLLIDEEEPEAYKFKRAMVLMGVPGDRIMTDIKSRNTHESAVNVKEMLDRQEYKDSDCLLITSAFHMRRSRACFRKAGMDPDTFTTDFYAHARQYYPDAFLLPRLDALIVWHKLSKEWVGFIAYKLAGYI